MVLPIRLRAARFALVLLFHGMGLCVAADNDASTGPRGAADETRLALALLLPLASPDFARPADALRLGFMAAHAHSGEKLTIGVFATDASSASIVAGYDKAVMLGARLIIGPMTRRGVSALAASKSVRVPTLGLNLPEDKTPLPPQLYTFGLALEAEAELVARSAYADLFRSAILVSAKTALAQRSRDAFARAWRRLGGTIREAHEFGPQTDLPALREALAAAQVDMIFLAADAEQARRARPFLGDGIALFATSQINSSRDESWANSDLNGVRFVDMPWLVQPDHPAVMVYPRPAGITAESERFYALGIDAFRIASALLEGAFALSLDGVTGRLTLYRNQVAREPVQAQFRNGAIVTLEHGARSENLR